ncbi:MarR family winged helix-turn-helix transcriptional regulator [Kushneria phosphatilytica]|uniref:MarR family winged helix-turn-helix transcriptional regulator n=1 Tax=Kushneria phosphatilytica TaxID=657387 RepID=UPI0023E3CB5C|nr:MarR family winged helix-turn-helix transcriptional regulator [Kushneria phosphatilytica]
MKHLPFSLWSVRSPFWYGDWRPIRDAATTRWNEPTICSCSCSRSKSRSLPEHWPSSLGLDSSTVTRQINVMLRHELITRTPDPHDRRGGLLYLTDHGRQQLDQMRKLRRESARELFADWDEPSRAELARLLERLNNTIEQRVAEHFSRSRS